MNKKLKIGLLSSLLMTFSTATIVPVSSCSFNNQYNPSNPDHNLPFQFENYLLNYYSDVDTSDNIGWVTAMRDVIENQVDVEKTTNAKFSTWNKTINEKVFSQDVDNNLLAGKKVTELYNINSASSYSEHIKKVLNGQHIADLIIDIFSQMFNSFNNIKEKFDTGKRNVLLNLLEELKKIVPGSAYALLEKIKQKIYEKFPEINIIEVEIRKKTNDYFPHISPIIEDNVYNSSTLTQEQKEAYKSFNFFNDYLNFDTNYIFDRYLFFHLIDSLIYANSYNIEFFNFITITGDEFSDAVDALIASYFTDWTGFIKIILLAAIESVPIMVEAMLLEDMYIRIDRWTNLNDSEWYEPIYESIKREISNRWTIDLLPMLNRWVSAAFSYINQDIPLNMFINFKDEFLDIANEVGVQLTDLDITENDISSILEEFEDRQEHFFNINISLDFSFIYEMLSSIIAIQIVNSYSNSLVNVVTVFQNIIDNNLSTTRNLDLSINNIYNWIQRFITDYSNKIGEFNIWFDNISIAIRNDVSTNSNSTLGNKINEKFFNLILLFTDFENNKNEIKNLMDEINNII